MEREAGGEGSASLLAVLVFVLVGVPEMVRVVEGEPLVEGVEGRVRVGATLVL